MRSKRFPKKTVRWWLGRLFQVAMAVFTVILLCHPTLHVFAPLLDLVGTVGVDGLLLILEVQLLAWSIPILRHHIVPLVTRCWNRQVATRFGLQPSENIFFDATLRFFHFLLMRGGAAGLVVYLFYIGFACHFSAHVHMALS
jgi:hypothetical protein